MAGKAPRFKYPRLAATLLVAGSLAFSAGVAEVIVRIAFPHTRDGVVPTNLLEMDALLGWRLRKSFSAVHHTRYFETKYNINEWGYRDRSRGKALAAGSMRAILMGDSQIFGWGVAEGERFSDQLEKACPGLEVWNTGVPGYGFDQELLAYERDAADIPATTAVFFFSGATLSRIKTDSIFSKSKPMFGLDAKGEPALRSTPGSRAAAGSALYSLLSPFYLPYFIQNRLAMLKDAGAGGKAGRKGSDEPLTGLAEALILRAKRSAEARNQRFVLLSNLRGGRLDLLRSFCGRNGVALAAIEIDPNTPGAVFGPEDPHWTPRTHARLARELEPVLCGGGQR